MASYSFPLAAKQTYSWFLFSALCFILKFHKVDWAPDWAFLPTFPELKPFSLCILGCVSFSVTSLPPAFCLLRICWKFMPTYGPSPFFLLLCVVDAVGTHISSSLLVSQHLSHFQLPAPSTLRGFYLAVGVCSACPWGRLEEPESVFSH